MANRRVNLQGHADPLTGAIKEIFAGDIPGAFPTPIGVSYDLARSRAKSGLLANLFYSMLPVFGAFGTQLTSLPPGTQYYDSSAASGGDGSLAFPKNTIDATVWNTPDTTYALAYGSKFLVATERAYALNVRAQRVQMTAYGDPTKGKPVIYGAVSLDASAFQATGVNGEYKAPLVRVTNPQCMAIGFADDPGHILPNGTPGSLAAGQAGADLTGVYLSAQPAAGRKVLVSVAIIGVLVEASHFRADSIALGYTINNGWQFTAPTTAVAGSPDAYCTDAILRDCESRYCGNNGLQNGSTRTLGVDVSTGYTNVYTIRFTDTGAYNNGINGNGKDGGCIHIEPSCYGKLRGIGASGAYTGNWNQGGYYNDGITAHGFDTAPWLVVGATVSNCKENTVDIIGGPNSGDAHVGSQVLFSDGSFCGEAVFFLWARNSNVIGCIATDGLQSGICFGDSSASTTIGNNYAAGNYIARCGTSGAASGIEPRWCNVTVDRCTIEIPSNAVRAAFGNTPINPAGSNPITNFTVRGCIIVQLNTGVPIIEFNSSNSTGMATMFFSDNVYITTEATPFWVGGNHTDFPTYQASLPKEYSGRVFTSASAAGLSGTYYVPTMGGVLECGAPSCGMSYDLNGRLRTGGYGASSAVRPS